VLFNTNAYENLIKLASSYTFVDILIILLKFGIKVGVNLGRVSPNPSSPYYSHKKKFTLLVP
jgi:hypothetical protein